MTNQFYYDSDPQCGCGIETDAVPVSVLQTMRHLFDGEPVFFLKHLDPHAAVFHNTKCSLPVPVSVLPIPPTHRRFPSFFQPPYVRIRTGVSFFYKLYQRNYRYQLSCMCVYLAGTGT
jgi:hypothetical protein